MCVFGESHSVGDLIKLEFRSVCGDGRPGQCCEGVFPGACENVEMVEVLHCLGDGSSQSCEKGEEGEGVVGIVWLLLLLLFQV